MVYICGYMVKNRLNETAVLLLGDVLAFVLALWLTLLLRYLEVPKTGLFVDHLEAFGLIFLIWIGVFFIFDLYRRSVAIFRRRLTATILNAQIVNSIIAGLIFYLWPSLGLAPRVNLLIYLILSFVAVVFWRQYLLSGVYQQKKEKVFFACSGPDVEELISEIKHNSTYQLEVLDCHSLDEVNTTTPTWVVFNPHDPALLESLPKLYQLVFSSVRLVNVHDFYEEVFDRVPVSIIDERWFLENISVSTTAGYGFLKRLMDIIIALVLFAVSLIFYPFVFLMIKFDDGGVMFSRQRRIGQNSKQVEIIKFRTMSIANDGGQWGQTKNTITRVGKFLRKTRIDELPQLLNVIRGDISLIGPRPEFPEPVALYSEQIPYYNIRHLIKPGLSGWAQMYHDRHPHHGLDVLETKNKLSYDLYYLKNRGLWLDLTIALKTIRTLLSTKGV